MGTVAGHHLFRIKQHVPIGQLLVQVLVIGSGKHDPILKRESVYHKGGRGKLCASTVTLDVSQATGPRESLQRRSEREQETSSAGVGEGGGCSLFPSSERAARPPQTATSDQQGRLHVPPSPACTELTQAQGP